MLGPKLLILIGLSLQAWDVSARRYHRQSLPKPDHLNHVAGCYSPYTGRVHPFGVTVYPEGVCKKLVCGKNGYTEIHTCDKKLVPEGCYLSKVTDQHYPHCCPQVICDIYYRDDDSYSVDPIEQNSDTYVDHYDYAETEPCCPDEAEYGTLDYDQPRVRRSVENYKPNKRGDDYKLDEVTTNYYDVKDVSSRRSPWNKNKNV